MGNSVDKESDKPTLRILCFGDSLTAGHYRSETDYWIDKKTGYPSPIFHSPYANTLEKILKEKLPDTIPFIVKEAGQDGQCGVDMNDRLMSELKKARYDLVIILCGSNDLALVSDTQRIIDGIHCLHNTATSKDDTQTIAITIPESKGGIKFEMAIQKRNAINSAIRNTYENIFDMEKLLPYGSITEQERKLWWNDGLHLNPVGYERMAELLWENTVESLVCKWIHNHYPSQLDSVPTSTEEKKEECSSETQSNSNKETKTMNILCFGDSLTSGYHITLESDRYGGIKHAPYGKFLEDIINEKYADSVKAQTTISGQDGQCVSTMMPRLSKLLYCSSSDSNNSDTIEESNKVKPLSITTLAIEFDIIIILGGTNDIGLEANSELTNRALQRLYEIAIGNTNDLCRIIAVTIPQCDADSTMPFLVEKRNVINQFIVDYVAKVNKKWSTIEHCSLNNKMILFDLNQLLPFQSMAESDREIYWNDGLHFSKKGYQRMAHLIAQLLEKEKLL